MQRYEQSRAEQKKKLLFHAEMEYLRHEWQRYQEIPTPTLIFATKTIGGVSFESMALGENR